MVVRTGRDTEFGGISARLHVEPPRTEFERGLRRFGYFLIEVTLVLVTAIFAFNVYLQKPVLDSFLFALALAVGLTPQLLPAIISVNLAKGAKDMAARKVIVKRLTAIENFGSMDVLCSDKTGTLTEGRVQLDAALDAHGGASDRVSLHAYVNASFQSGYANPIDRAICERREMNLVDWTNLDEIPYDFIRRRLSVLALCQGRAVMISKGSLAAVLDACSHAESDQDIIEISGMRSGLHDLQARFEGDGCRTLGVAVREMAAGTTAIKREDENGMTFIGILVLRDPPKAGADQAVASLARLGVSLKIITGDSALIAERVARQVGISAPVVLTGEALQTIGDDALPVQADRANVFAEIEPGQKERIIRALQRRGHVVGYMGDGINDAPALHTADVSISVQEGADVAKAAADIVLLEQDLGVLEHGVRDGRRTFANTLKYVFMATSANFGNMFSMAGASISAVPAAAAEADPVDESPDRPARADHCHRSCRSGLDRPAATMGCEVHSPVHAGVWCPQLGLRLHDVRRAALVARRWPHRVSHGAAPRVRRPSGADCAGGAPSADCDHATIPAVGNRTACAT